jgi:hypothetical protein
MDKIQSFQFGTVLVCVNRFKLTLVIDHEFTCISIRIEVQFYDISNPLTSKSIIGATPTGLQVNPNLPAIGWCVKANPNRPFFSPLRV